MLAATHIIVFSEKVVFRDVGAQQGVAHQVDKAQTQALESRYGAGKEQVGHTQQSLALHPLTCSHGKEHFRVWLLQAVAPGSCAWSCFQERQLCAWPLQTCITGVRAGRRELCVGCLCLTLKACLSSNLTRRQYRTTSNVHSCSSPGAKFPEGVLKYISISIYYTFLYIEQCLPTM